MTDRDAMFRACLDHPADDTPRLVLADWLSEDGRSARDRARAELIRLQCARYNRTGDTSTAKQLAVAESVKREEAILRKWGAGWLPRELRPASFQMRVRGETVKIGQDSFTFERGFPSWVRLVWGLPWREREAEDAGHLCRAALAGYPVERIVLEVNGYEPEVAIRINCRRGVWSAEAAAEYPTGIVDVHLCGTCGYPARRGLVAYMPGFLPLVAGMVEFRPRPVEVPF